MTFYLYDIIPSCILSLFIFSLLSVTIGATLSAQEQNECTIAE
jgi:hypothetical protein